MGGDVPFHLTVMGRRFYEAMVQAPVEAIEQLNANIERLLAQRPAEPTEPTKPSSPPER